MTSKSVKTKTKVPAIPGTKRSVKSVSFLVSTGIPSLDHIIGGGLPIGTIFLIEEDTYGTYANVVLKYFMAESVVTTQPLLVASQDTPPSQIILQLPAPIAETTPETQIHNVDDQMKIAWRYQNMKIIDPSPIGGQPFGHYYDLTKTIDKNQIEKSNITQWHEESESMKSDVFENPAYADLLRTIHDTLKNGQYFISDTPDERQVLRVTLHSLGSRLWLCDSAEDTHQDLLKFIYLLRALLRTCYAVAAITIPINHYENSDAVISRIENISDVAIKLESFAGSTKETNPLFKDYHGLLHIKKLPAINTFAPHSPDSRDLVFKLRRKKFVIEVLHLPPEFEDTTQREQDDTIPSTIGCAIGTKKSLLDF